MTSRAGALGGDLYRPDLASAHDMDEPLARADPQPCLEDASDSEHVVQESYRLVAVESPRLHGKGESLVGPARRDR